MKRLIAVALLTVLATADIAEARRTRVVVRAGFPVRRTLPNVVVRRPVAVRVTPAVYLPAVVFRSVAIASVPGARVWSDAEELRRADGWTDFTMNVDRSGDRLFLQVDEGPAEISVAEVVFENGQSQVVDFNDKTYRQGVYPLLDFKDGRRLDHVRIVAKANGRESEIRLHLVK
jgi:hypothetical protein